MSSAKGAGRGFVDANDAMEKEAEARAVAAFKRDKAQGTLEMIEDCLDQIQ
jgi:hypothetical protein